jgi:hypothetical protein
MLLPYKQIVKLALYCILTVLTISLPVNGTAAPIKFKPINLPGTGRVILPATVKISLLPDSKIPHYSLIVDDGQILHAVQLYITNNPQELYAIADAPITPALSAKTKITLLHKALLAQEGDKLLAAYAPEPAGIPGYEGWSAGYRAALGNNQTYPVYTRIYLLSSQKENKAMIFACPDSDKTYWEPIMRKMIASLISPVIIYRL